MAGIYLHIPFCKKRCIYCDFFSDTRLHWKQKYLAALCEELKMRYAELDGAPVQTLYFGGGTPSGLTAEELNSLWETMAALFPLSDCEEITLEANPDDLTPAYIAMLKHTPVNRISMGVQSFDEQDLIFLNRRHTAAQAEEAFIHCREAGFGNISIDLIYGLPGQTMEGWKNNLERAVALQPDHISAYNLIYEEGTALYRLRESGKVTECRDELALDMFDWLINRLTAAGYEHYEISNFARPGMYSRHNTSYWQDVPYLGLGASAHSYNGTCRSWNVRDIPEYIRGISAHVFAGEKEQLSENDKYNDMVLTALRTRWGLDLKRLESRFGTDLKRYCLACAQPYIESGKLSCKEEILTLTRSGLFVSDGIMADLMKVDD
ncbi:MAG: radical SAM family heme chaperone HemW [Coprobacter sp.]|nr:radical SAM family heme chaperone HemW [Coprobacter sp.]